MCVDYIDVLNYHHIGSSKLAKEDCVISIFLELNNKRLKVLDFYLNKGQHLIISWSEILENISDYIDHHEFSKYNDLSLIFINSKRNQDIKGVHRKYIYKKYIRNILLARILTDGLFKSTKRSRFLSKDVNEHLRSAVKNFKIKIYPIVSTDEYFTVIEDDFMKKLEFCQSNPSVLNLSYDIMNINEEIDFLLVLDIDFVKKLNIFDIVDKFIYRSVEIMKDNPNFGMSILNVDTFKDDNCHINYLIKRDDLQILSEIFGRDISLYVMSSYTDFNLSDVFILRKDFIYSIVQSFGIEFLKNILGNKSLSKYLTFFSKVLNFPFVEIDVLNNEWILNSCKKCLEKITTNLSIEYCNRLVDESDVVIFDVFDTLLTRITLYPTDIFYGIDRELSVENGKELDFYIKRRKAEDLSRHKKILLEKRVDTSFDDIYRELQSLIGCDDELLEYIKNKEIEWELKSIIPKDDVVDILRYSVEKDKEVILVSDMYLSSDTIKNILSQKIPDIDFSDIKLIVSSESDMAKYDGSVWKYLKEKLSGKKAIIFGDNEISDVKIPTDYGFKAVHLFSKKTALENSDLYKEIKSYIEETEGNLIRLLFGPSINFLYNSPFKIKDKLSPFDYKLSPYEFGFICMGPFVFLFINYLFFKYKNRNCVLYFLSREGFFIKELFDYYCELLGNPKIKTEYLLTSRRSTFGAVRKNEEVIEHLCYGLRIPLGEMTFSSLLINRLGIDLSILRGKGSKIEDFLIESRQDIDRAYSILIENMDIINEHTASEYNSYISYLHEIGFFDNKEIVLVDYGYSGTAQTNLYRLTNRPIVGEYFITTNKVSQYESEENKYFGYFEDKIDPYNTTNPLYIHMLVFESIFTSDKGQLLFFDKNGKPVFDTDTKDISLNKHVIQGIKDYIYQITKINPLIFYEIDANTKDKSLVLYKYFLKYSLLDDNLNDIFVVEDKFGIGGHIDARVYSRRKSKT